MSPLFSDSLNNPNPPLTLTHCPKIGFIFVIWRKGKVHVEEPANRFLKVATDNPQVPENAYGQSDI